MDIRKHVKFLIVRNLLYEIGLKDTTTMNPEFIIFITKFLDTVISLTKTDLHNTDGFMNEIITLFDHSSVELTKVGGKKKTKIKKYKKTLKKTPKRISKRRQFRIK